MRDKVLGYLQYGKFSEIIEVLKDNNAFNNLLEDSIFKTVFFQNFTNELFSQVNLEITYPAFLLHCHDSKDYVFQLDKKDEGKLLEFLILKTKEYNYAIRLPEFETSIEIISEHETRLKIEAEKGLKNAQKQKDFKVVEKYAENVNFLIKSIFNSPQEKEFYLACKSEFESYLILPNVSLSTIFNHEVVKKRFPNYFNFYLTSSVDMVIVDEETHIPILFFELDSKTFHDANSSQRDKIKNLLFTELGNNLIRITKRTGSEGIKEYIELLKAIKEEKNII